MTRACAICGEPFELSGPASRQQFHKKCKRRQRQQRYYEENFKSLHVPELFRPAVRSVALPATSPRGPQEAVFAAGKAAGK